MPVTPQPIYTLSYFCSRCSGTGHVTQTVDPLLPPQTINCPNCSGTGKIAIGVLTPSPS